MDVNLVDVDFGISISSSAQSNGANSSPVTNHTGDSADTTLQATELMEKFQAEREATRINQFNGVVNFGIRYFIALGIVIFFSDIVVYQLSQVYADSIYRRPVSALGLLLFNMGVVIVSTVPIEFLDIDHIMESPHSKYIWTRYVVSFITTCGAACLAVIPPYTGVFDIIVSIYIAFNLNSETAYPWNCFTFKMGAWFVLFNAILSTNCAYYAAKANEAPKTIIVNFPDSSPMITHYSVLCVYFMLSSWALFRTWRLELARHWRARKLKDEITSTSNGTTALYVAMYGFAMILGVGLLIEGIWLELLIYLVPNEGFTDVGASRLAAGVTFLVPPAIVTIFTRERVFNFMARQFDRDPSVLEKDGAFIAGLLDMVDISLDQEWWIHRNAGDEDNTFTDHRKNWLRGKIVARTTDEFAVELDVHQGLGLLALGGQHPGGGTQSAPPTANPLNISATRTLSAGRADRTSASAAVNLGESSPIKAPQSPNQDNWKWVKIGATLPSSELVDLARSNLRCIDWRDLTEDLLTNGSVRDASKGSFFSLSRPVKQGEAIDYFISHSWHDDGAAKYVRLSELAAKHKRASGKDPTFWFDKVCIDQSNIGAGLKVLPINVMACKRMLVLCGHTYAQRLWCVWELCTLFSFVQEELALERVELLPLSKADDDVMEKLKTFDVKDSHCYDPNEEAKLHKVINLVGKARFHARIHRLAALCSQSQAQAQAQGSPATSPRLGLSRFLSSKGATPAPTPAPAPNDAMPSVGGPAAALGSADGNNLVI